MTCRTPLRPVRDRSVQIACPTICVVPGGTVDFITTICPQHPNRPISEAASCSVFKSACPFFPAGVPTVMKTNSPHGIAASASVVNCNRPSDSAETSMWGSPSSKIGHCPFSSILQRYSSFSRQMTWWPPCAKHTAATSPT